MYPTVSQFKDQMMVICDCHSEGLVFDSDKNSKEIYITHWVPSSNSGIFSYNIVDAFRYLFTGHDRTMRMIDVDREGMYQIACFINDALKLKKKIKKEATSKEKIRKNFYINGKDHNRLIIKSDDLDFEESYSLYLEHFFECYNKKQYKWKTFWKILTKGTSGVNWIVIEEFEANMFLDFMIDCLSYEW